MLKLLRYFKTKQWIMSLISMFFIVAQVWLDLKMPDYMQEITRLVQTPGSKLADIWSAGGLMILCALGSLAGAVVVGFLASRIAASFSMQLRGVLFEKVQSFSLQEINHFSTASLITRSTNDITQVQSLLAIALQLVVKAPITAIWAIRKIAGKGYEWSLATGVTVLIIAVIVVLVMIFVMPKFLRMQTLTDNITRVARENLSGLRVVRAYNAEAYQEEKFENANKKLTDTQLFTTRVMAMLFPLMTIITGGLTLAIYWLGAYLIMAASASYKLIVFADMVVFSQYATQVIFSFVMLLAMFVMYPRASVSAKRINEVLNTTPTITDGKYEDGMPGLKGTVSFRDVSFKYPDAEEYILQNIDLDIRQGETVAFIGSTGSGKSTLINLVPRFFDVSDGEILVDGINIKDYKLSALYDKIGYVSQQAVLFSGDVTSNVAYGKSDAEEKIRQAIEIAQATEFVKDMDKDYHADIARGGTNISGGQKQRLAIARAVYRQPEIYIFDDAFSALDYKTDRALRKELKKAAAKATNLIVSQRIGTIMDADQIIVLDEGKIVGKGKHQELLDNCRVYQEIAYSQLNEEELKR